MHFDCGLDFPENTEYMSATATAQGWNYQPICVGDGLTEMIANGSWDHAAEVGEAYYWWVIVGGPAEMAHERYGDCLIWGLRADESRARRWALAVDRGHGAGVRVRNDGTTTLGPIWSWTRGDVFAYHRRHNIDPNPLYAHMASIGVPENDQRVDVAIGSNGVDRGRLAWLKRGWPDLYRRYAALLPRMDEMS